LADRLKQPVERLQRETTNEQFLKWQTYLKMEPNLFHREDFYMVLLIRAVRNVLNFDPDFNPSLDLHEGLLKFGVSEKELKEQEKTKQELRSDKPSKMKDHYAGHIPVGPSTKGIFLSLLGLKEPTKDD
jgi:hypothetical protein